MSADKLVSMANQVAAFFAAYPQDDAATGVADHLAAFWTPAMRRALAERVAAQPGGLHPIVLRAVRAPDAPGESPIAKQIAGPGELGELGSDAG